MGHEIFKGHSAAKILFAALAAALCLYLLSWFIRPLAWAMAISIGSWPLYVRLRSALRPIGLARLAPLIGCGVVSLCILLPLVFGAFSLLEEIQSLLAPQGLIHRLNVFGLAPPAWLAEIPGIGSFLSSLWIDMTPKLRGFFQNSPEVALSWTGFLGAEALQRVALTFGSLFILYFFYQDGEIIAKKTQRVFTYIFGLSVRRFLSRQKGIIRSTFVGFFLLGLAEGSLIAAAFSAAHVSHGLLWGFITGFLAPIPFLAPAFAALVCLGIFLAGDPVSAISVGVFCFVVLFVVDSVLRPALSGRAHGLGFFWSVAGLFGGLHSFGLIGLFLGPAIVGAALFGIEELFSLIKHRSRRSQTA